MWVAAVPTHRMVKEINVSAVERGAYQCLAGSRSFQGSFDSSTLGRHHTSELGRIMLLTLNPSVSGNMMEDTRNADLLRIEWPIDL